MRKYGDIEDIRQELKGKTMLIPEYEEMLFERIAVAEQNDGLVAPLAKGDWIGIWVLLIGSIVSVVLLFMS